MKLRKLTKDEVTFSIEVEVDDTPIKDNAIDSSDKEHDKKVEDFIINELIKGNTWAWASVTVTAEWRNLVGVDYLGCCSYKNEAEFKSDAYYEDMKAEALSDLNATIKNVYNRIEELIIK